ncbi:MFS transporter [Streptomyces sp. NPDC048479]|uniref:MFS transporter n=1 Tax=Streptomyces sp. NPDC048479 TaxID=3154725 RepID=UPI003420A30C
MSTRHEGYVALLRTPGVPRIVLPSVIARLPIGMTAVLLILLVQQGTGSYRTAGLAMAVNSLAFAATAPWFGRLADRGHAAAVILITGCAHPVALIGLLLAVHVSAPDWAVLAGAAAAGGICPPVAAVTRALWPRLVDEDMRPTAYGLEAVLAELTYVLGPMVAGIVLAVAGASAGLLVAAAAVLAGSVGLARARPVREFRAAPATGPRRHVLASPALRAVLLVTTVTSVAFGILEVAVPAFAVEHGSPAAGGILVALWSTASVIGGLLYVRRRWKSPLTRQFAVLTGANAVSFALLALADEPWQLGVLLVLGGVLLAPAAAVEYALVSHAADPSAATQAFTWFGTAAYIGSAVGGALGGALVAPLGLTMVFLAAAACGLLGGVCAWRVATLLRGV